MKANPTNIRIATRSSPLALWQANTVASRLSALGITSTIVKTETKGDIILDKPLHDIGGKGLFIKELEKSLLEDKADIAVHSLKDLPAKLEDCFELAAVLDRHHSGDLLLLQKDHPAHAQIPTEVNLEQFKKLGLQKIATGSLRRGLYCSHADKKLAIEPLRGNIQTRLQKLADSDWDGIILAEAAYERLELRQAYKSLKLQANWFVPSACQGVVGIECKKDSDLQAILQKINCSKTQACVTIERQILAAINASCTTPIGCHVSANKENPSSYDIQLRIIADRSHSLDLKIKNIEAENALRKVLEELRKHPKASYVRQKLQLKI